MTSLRIPLAVPGVTEAEVDADARVVGVQRHINVTDHFAETALEELGIPSEKHGYYLILDVPESPRVRLERRRFHVLSNPPEGSGWPLVETVLYRNGDYGIWQERLFVAPAAIDGEVAG